jgi:hypothetical protein
LFISKEGQGYFSSHQSCCGNLTYEVEHTVLLGRIYY